MTASQRRAFELLRRVPDLGEVNFWAPSAKTFGALRPGELFLFKLHAPRDVIVGVLEGQLGARGAHHLTQLFGIEGVELRVGDHEW